MNTPHIYNTPLSIYDGETVLKQHIFIEGRGRTISLCRQVDLVDDNGKDILFKDAGTELPKPEILCRICLRSSTSKKHN